MKNNWTFWSVWVVISAVLLCGSINTVFAQEVDEISGQEAEYAADDLQVQVPENQDDDEASVREQEDEEAIARQQAEASTLEQEEAEAIVRQQAEESAREQAEAEAAAQRPQYTVKEGDSYWSIAANPLVYNNPWLWRRLYEANRDKMEDPNNPNLIEPGMVIIFSMPRYYTVQSGDSYWRIAADPLVYNNPRLWRGLYEANRDKMEDPNNPNLIEPGMVIEIPSLNGEYREGTR
ncbi:hypothetical protein AGMMS50267_05980 [Spirochaetia bacterium]|nr:hypothetical protein AGMMS50267_05980 [Spirochaetia bacterium]